MKFSFSQRSKDRLKGVHPVLVDIVDLTLGTGIMDFGVYEGVRAIEQQQIYFDTGRTTTMNSKHLVQPDGFGHAVDLYPYPINMKKVNQGNAQEIVRFGVLAGIMKTMALRITSEYFIRWGGDWDSDGQTLDHSFFDAMHFEIRRKT